MGEKRLEEGLAGVRMRGLGWRKLRHSPGWRRVLRVHIEEQRGHTGGQKVSEGSSAQGSGDAGIEQTTSVAEEKKPNNNFHRL